MLSGISNFLRHEPPLGMFCVFTQGCRTANISKQLQTWLWGYNIVTVELVLQYCHGWASTCSEVDVTVLASNILDLWMAMHWPFKS